MRNSDECEPWTFGIGELMRNLAKRKCSNRNCRNDVFALALTHKWSVRMRMPIYLIIASALLLPLQATAQSGGVSGSGSGSAGVTTGTAGSATGSSTTTGLASGTVRCQVPARIPGNGTVIRRRGYNRLGIRGIGDRPADPGREPADRSEAHGHLQGMLKQRRGTVTRFRQIACAPVAIRPAVEAPP